jgi:hypothetical protein
MIIEEATRVFDGMPATIQSEPQAIPQRDRPERPEGAQ